MPPKAAVAQPTTGSSVQRVIGSRAGAALRCGDPPRRAQAMRIRSTLGGHLIAKQPGHKLLRSDVAANCRRMIELAGRRLPVLVPARCGTRNSRSMLQNRRLKSRCPPSTRSQPDWPLTSARTSGGRVQRQHFGPTGGRWAKRWALPGAATGSLLWTSAFSMGRKRKYTSSMILSGKYHPK